jgi:hypothetical protein
LKRLKIFRKNRRAQTQQVFIYILAILIVGATLLFGFKAIKGIIHQQCDVDQTTYITELKQMIEQNTNYLDSSRKTIKAPCEYNQLCFINTTLNNPDVLSNYPSLKQEYSAGTGNNVFLVSSSGTRALFGLDSIVIDGASPGSGVLCLNSTGNLFYLKLDGIGKGKVRISADNG